MTDRPTVLFVCVHNAGRSQMAAALLTKYAAGRVEVLSAGSAPADTINPAVMEAMRELDIDLATERPKLLTTAAVEASDVVITMGCGDACPIYPGQAVPGLGTRRSGRPGRRRRPADPRRHRSPGARPAERTRLINGVPPYAR